jgi:hypothetical protein
MHAPPPPSTVAVSKLEKHLRACTKALMAAGQQVGGRLGEAEAAGCEQPANAIRLKLDRRC